MTDDSPHPAAVEIRPATDADLDALSELEAALFGTIAWSRAALKDELDGAGRLVVVAASADKLSGYAIALKSGDDADLQRIAVERASQRSGIGAQMLDALLAECRRMHLVRVMLEVAADNVPARAFYLRHGFTEISRRPRYYADGRDAIVMGLPLPATAEPGDE